MTSRLGISRSALIAIVVVVVVVVVVGAVLGWYYSTVSHKPSAPSPTAPTTVEFLTWWGPEDPQGLTWVAGNFSKYYPGYSVEYYSIPGAGGTNAKYVILGMLEAGKPPASFQAHFAPEVLSYVEIMPHGPADFVNFTPIAIQTGLLSKGVTEAVLAGMFNGTMFALPTNVHRGGMLYFNPQVLAEYGLPIPTTVEQLANETLYLASHGMSCVWIIPGGDGGWDQLNLWEYIFLGLAGEKYGPATAAQLMNEFLYGVLNLNDPAIASLINETNYYYLLFTKYDCPGWQTMTWSSGLAYIIQGKAAFQVNGNWITEYAYIWYHTITYPAIPPYTSWTNITLMEEPFPGTQGVYVLVIDSVAVPAYANPYEDAAIKLAEFWDSYVGMMIWTSSGKGVIIWSNGTDFYPTPAQWFDYEQLLSTPSSQFTIAPSDGGLFDDVFSNLNSQVLNLQQVGESYIPTFMSALVSAEQSTYNEWMAAVKLGLGYMGYPGHPFANYLPPWVNPTTYHYQPYTPWWQTSS
ncbi:glucose ABC transporter substrate-binding protein GlcS [Vulcanisaeta sp. JCM 14467]